MNPEELRALLKQGRHHNKHGVAPASERTIGARTFASKGEMRRYLELQTLEAHKAIADLQLQVHFPLVVNGQKIATYVADFTYRDLATGETIIEDFKGYASPVYKLKAKLMLALYGYVILETHADHTKAGGQPWKPPKRHKRRR